MVPANHVPSGPHTAFILLEVLASAPRLVDGHFVIQEVHPFEQPSIISCIHLQSVTLIGTGEIYTHGAYCYPQSSGSPETLIRCLKTTPSLIYLEFEPFHPLFLSSLFSELSIDSHFLPNLDSLHTYSSAFALSDSHFSEPQLLVEMLRRRRDAVGVARLRSFRMPDAHRNLFLDEEANAQLTLDVCVRASD
ncbi:hypothetical protein R3P38DRAFT_539946 [Favolaschia claudopus]|uniref:Uncharacterized protein n=1 Tax=Favolaschia claudopus TaxID=2862362 RepID=A0AAW0CF26_9AGAR